MPSLIMAWTSAMSLAAAFLSFSKSKNAVCNRHLGLHKPAQFPLRVNLLSCLFLTLFCAKWRACCQAMGRAQSLYTCAGVDDRPQSQQPCTIGRIPHLHTEQGGVLGANKAADLELPTAAIEHFRQCQRQKRAADLIKLSNAWAMHCGGFIISILSMRWRD